MGDKAIRRSSIAKDLAAMYGGGALRHTGLSGTGGLVERRAAHQPLSALVT